VCEHFVRSAQAPSRSEEKSLTAHNFQKVFDFLKNKKS